MSDEFGVQNSQAGAQEVAPAETVTINPEPDVQEPGTQAGLQQSVSAEPVTVDSEQDGSASAPLSESEYALPAAEWDTQQYEDKVAKRLRQNAPKFAAKDKAAKLAVHIAGKLKNQLAYDLAIWKAIKVGKGRDGEWGPFVEKELKLNRRTVDRWIEKKLDGDQLPPWAADRLRSNKKDVAKPGDDQDTPDHQETGPTGGGAFQFTEALPEGTEILEWAVPVTANEKAELLENLRFFTVEEAKRLFIEAVRNAAVAKRGHQADPAPTQPETEAAQAASDPTEQPEAHPPATAKKRRLRVSAPQHQAAVAKEAA